MNLRQIEVFQAVMQTGSTVEAARLLHVSQPGISRMLAHIELQLGLTLFERRKGKLLPTPQADALYAEVRQVYRGVQRIDDCVRALKHGGHQTLRVLCSPSTGLALVPGALAALSRRQPEARFQIETLPAREIETRLVNREADLAISTVPIEHPVLQRTPLGHWTLACIFPAGHVLAGHAQVTATQLLQHRLITFGAQTPQARFVEQCSQAAGLPVQSAIEVRSGLMACALAAQGAGVAVVDDFTARAFSHHGLEHRPIDSAPRLQVELVVNLQFAASPLVGQLVEGVRQALQRGDAGPPQPA